MPQIVIASPETFSENCVLTIDYLIGEAVEAILAKRPQIDSDIAMAIHKAIQRMSRRLSSRLWMDPERPCSQTAGMVITILFVFLICSNVTVFFANSVASASAASDATARAPTGPNDEGATIQSVSSHDGGNPI
ncbi:hypothetical protein CcaCcLH18_02777 [Colletotrichum camelliae]|nr:hypothetical protein CcaCcLH18_02777 [Colletotrichum camelliae]